MASKTKVEGMCPHHPDRKTWKSNLCKPCFERGRLMRVRLYRQRQGMTHNEAEEYLERKIQEESLPAYMRRQ